MLDVPSFWDELQRIRVRPTRQRLYISKICGRRSHPNLSGFGGSRCQSCAMPICEIAVALRRLPRGAKLRMAFAERPMTLTCKFCSVFHLAATPCDRPVLRTPNFVVAPTVGALVPGWMLIVSNKHYIAAGALEIPMLEELRETIRTVAAAMQRDHRTAAVFEHGPVCENSAVGCGIDHCHVHVVPVEFDLFSEAASLSAEAGIQWETAADLTVTNTYHRAGRPYLYLEQNGVRRIGSSRSLPSQFFRRVIASRQGRPQEFDWKAHDVVSSAHLREARRLSLALGDAP